MKPKYFADKWGIYPVGSLLKTDTGELGIVMNIPKNGNKGLSQIVLLRHNGNGKFRKGNPVDLSEKDPKKGSFKRNIAKSFHPSNFSIQPAEFIL